MQQAGEAEAARFWDWRMLQVHQGVVFGTEQL